MSTATLPLDRRNHFAENLKAEARRLLDACGVPATPNWVNRVVVRYLQSVAPTGFPFGPWLVAQVELTREQRVAALNDPEVRYCLDYSDPTGETAVRNVMRRHGL